MEAIRHVTCTQCHWSRWTESGGAFDDDADCPRCGGIVVIGKRPDDSYPNELKGSRFLRDSDPQIAILDTQPV
jgi:NAD-dependent SIR2 family protein deacetylase